MLVLVRLVSESAIMAAANCSTIEIINAIFMVIAVAFDKGRKGLPIWIFTFRLSLFFGGRMSEVRGQRSDGLGSLPDCARQAQSDNEIGWKSVLLAVVIEIR
jgi:hypothetical protein